MKRSTRSCKQACLRLVVLAASACSGTAEVAPEAFVFEAFTPDGRTQSVVVLAPGCGGVADRSDTQPMRPLARRLAAQGHHVVIADYESAYDMQRTCSRGARLEDVANAIALAADQGRRAAGLSDPVALVGWSLGGSGVFLAGDRIGADRVVALYPDCTPFASLSIHIDYLVLVGAEDRLTPLSECERIRKLSEAHGAQWVIYPQTHHGFDYKAFRGGLSAPANAYRDGFVAVEYNAEAAEDAHRRIIEFLARD
jgi:dienelactone hydrolase